LIACRSELCTYCGGCVGVCPRGALELKETRLVIVEERCNDCKLCIPTCPVGALVAEQHQPALGLIPMRRRYDLVVVGAGPAGSTAAWLAAEQGSDVLLLEKRQEIGSPVRCAEGINREMLLPFLEPEEAWVCAEVNESRIVNSDTGEAQSFAGDEVGYVLERRVFDRALAERAAVAGAQVMVKSSVHGLIVDEGAARGVRVSQGDSTFEIEASVVVGADGVECMVGRWAGLNCVLPQRDCLVCAQYLLAGIDVDPTCCHYYLGQHLAPGGYAWVFPKGRGKANVGLGVQADFVEAPALEYLNRFIARHRFLEQGSPVTLVTGNVPVGVARGDIVGDGVMLVGDAARQADTLTGGGIANAMIAGRLAAEVAARAVALGDTSRARLAQYQTRWTEERGGRMARNHRLKNRFSPAQRTSPSFLRAFALATAGK
jgi:digeranylgeranylglycerophospholipid reductase